MLALILDSLGSTELLFILVVALIFFGPRKLPQLAHQLGKGLAEFRKASDDFKRTWEREVALETSRLEPAENSILNDESNMTHADSQTVVQPVIAPPESDLVVPRQNPYQATVVENTSSENTEPEPLRKQDWL